MKIFLLYFLLGLATGKRRMRALVALAEEPAANVSAQRYKCLGFWLFMSSPAFFVAAALVDSFLPDARTLAEALGCSGLACIEGCFFCGYFGGSANKMAAKPEP